MGGPLLKQSYTGGEVSGNSVRNRYEIPPLFTDTARIVRRNDKTVADIDGISHRSTPIRLSATCRRAGMTIAATTAFKTVASRIDGKAPRKNAGDTRK